MCTSSTHCSVPNTKAAKGGGGGELDFNTITCVTWTASGRNFGIGTPDGFVIYSTELILPRFARREPCASQSGDTVGVARDGDLHEVCRCVIDGGVGTLALYEQSSIVAVSGVKDRVDAMTVRLLDLRHSRRPDRAATQLVNTAAVMSGAEVDVASSSSEYNVSIPSSSSTLSRSVEWGPQREGRTRQDTAVPLRPMQIAVASFEATVAGVRLCPCLILVALTGDPNVVGSHQVYAFDRRLRQRHVFAVFPPSSNAFLRDLVATATTFTPTTGAGVSIRRFRALLPGERRGEVRLLTLKYVSRAPAAAAGGEQPPPRAREVEEDDGVFVVGERVLHQSRLRAVAMTLDGRKGVTMGERGTHIKLLDFVEDNKIIECMTLERGRLAGVVESVTLQVVSVPPRHSGGGGEAPGPALVVCVTSTGTVHVFFCDGAAPQLLYTRDKHLCVPRNEYSFAYAAAVPQSALNRERCVLCVLQWRSALSAPRLRTATRTAPIETAATCGRRDTALTTTCRLTFYEVLMSTPGTTHAASNSVGDGGGLSHLAMTLRRHGASSLAGQSLTCAPLLQVPVDALSDTPYT